MKLAKDSSLEKLSCGLFCNLLYPTQKKQKKEKREKKEKKKKNEARELN